MELRKLDEEFEDVSVGAGEESSPHGGTPPRKMHFGTSALPELIVKYAPAAAVFVFSALTSGAPFVLDTYPFGIAALCAAEGSAFFIASLAGVLLGSLSVNGGVRIALIACAVSAVRCALVFLGRKRGRLPGAAGRGQHAKEKGDFLSGLAASALFCESETVRYALCTAAAAALGTLSLLFTGNVYRAAAGTIVSAAAAPLLCAGYTGIFRAKKSRLRLGAFVLAMVFSLSWAFGSLTVAGVSLSLVFAFAVSLWASWALFIPEALCVSFAASLSLKPALIPAILAASFVAGLLWKYSVSLASFAALAVSVSFSVFALGPSALSEYGAELIVVCAVFAPCAKFGILPRPSPNSGESFVPADESEVRLEESRRTVREMSECFSAIGRLASSVSRVLSRPSEAEIRENVQHTFDKRCTSCRMQSECWDSADSAAPRTVRRLSAALHGGKRASAQLAPEELRTRCPELASIIREMNIQAVEEKAQARKEDGSRLFADDWEVMSHLFSDVSDKLETDNRYDAASSRRLKGALALIGLDAPRVSVRGERMIRCTLSGIDARTMHVGSEDIRRCAENALGVRMSEPEMSLDRDTLCVTMHARTKFRVSCGRFTASAKSGACGDVISVFPGGDGYFWSILSDGMGSGTEAAFTAGTVTLILERLLAAGVKIKNALALVNSFIRERRIECSATVDAMELDLIRGNCAFIKSGAAPSFVLRGGRLFKLRSRTVPIGIMPSADAERIAFRVEAGDIVIMMSDGVTQTEEDCPWLYDILCSGRLTQLTSSAKRIADEAAKRSQDDISVVLMRIEEE